jgi:hypothetical protein
VIPIVSKQTIQQAKQLDLLTYLLRYEPTELVHVSGHEYSTKTHDSLKISNGKWHWFSRSIGGKTALDYLIHVKEMSFIGAVMKLTGDGYRQKISPGPGIDNKTKKESQPASKAGFILPQKHCDNERVVRYLLRRKICRQVIDWCIRHEYLYEEERFHNAVFVGKDLEGKPQHAMLRGSSLQSSFKKDAPGSDKRYTFSLSGASAQLYVFEGAIDLLSHVTLIEIEGGDWRLDHRLSLGGLSVLALDQYLKDHQDIKDIILCLDQDQPGREAAFQLQEKLKSKGYIAKDQPPSQGKDYNEQLQLYLRSRQAKHKNLYSSHYSTR